MSAETSLLHSLTRSKLHSSGNIKDQCSLHRWVLLKNSILSSSSCVQDTATSEYPEATPTYNNNNEEVDDDEEADEEIGFVDTFMFPDAGNFVTRYSEGAHDSEAQWLDSLLETLAEDEDDDFASDSEVHTSVLPVDEDDEQLLSPILSALSSSDDLHQSRYYSPSFSVSYSSHLSPFDSPLGRVYDFDPDPPYSSSASPYEDPLPYHDIDDIEESSLSDPIEDMSDDESDVPSTPSFGRSSTSLSLDSSASTSSQSERSRLRHPLPLVYVKNSSYLYPFELDPLPFREESSHYPSYSAY